MKNRLLSLRVISKRYERMSKALRFCLIQLRALEGCLNFCENRRNTANRTLRSSISSGHKSALLHGKERRFAALPYACRSLASALRFCHFPGNAVSFSASKVIPVYDDIQLACIRVCDEAMDWNFAIHKRMVSYTIHTAFNAFCYIIEAS